MANDYSLMASRLVTALQGLSGYSGLVVEKKQFKPDAMPSGFTRYGVIVSPHPRPWDERLVSVRSVQYTYRFDLYLFVLNFDPTDAVFGTTAGSLGLFEMVKDVKTLLRMHTLNGMLDKTYQEIATPIEYQELATPGFDVGSYSTVFRCKQQFQGRTEPFSHGVAT